MHDRQGLFDNLAVHANVIDPTWYTGPSLFHQTCVVVTAYMQHDIHATWLKLQGYYEENPELKREMVDTLPRSCSYLLTVGIE